MKTTYKKGLLRLAFIVMGVLLSLPLVKSFSFLVICALFSTGWVIYWLVGGFFNID